MEDCRGAELASPVQAIDTTPYLSDDLIAIDAIRLSDAAAAIDPISSSGVQKAIQSALAGAVVVQTPCSASPSGPTPPCASIAAS